MNTQLNSIDKLSKALKALLPMKAEFQERLDRKIRLEFNYNSNHLEGNTLTYGETELLLIFDKTTGKHEMREYEEMKAHDVAFELIKQMAADNERPLTETAIKNLHETLLVRPFWKDAITPDGQTTRRQIKTGVYKEFPNSVRLQNGEMFHYATPQETPAMMGDLIQWYRDEEEKKELHPVELAALLHYKFVLIHPFDDGNGRISRLLMNYVLLKHGLPPVIIKSAEKKDYLFALNQADTGNMRAFIDYISEQLIWSLELAIKAANGEDLKEPDEWKKKLDVLKKSISHESSSYEAHSPHSMYRLGHTLIIPLINLIIKEAAQVDDLFAGKLCYVIADNQSKDFSKAEELQSFFAVDAVRMLNKLDFSYQLQGYKHDGTNTFSISTGILWSFEAYRFCMSIKEGGTYRPQWFLYNHSFADSNMDLIKNQCCNSLLDQIEQQKGKSNIL